MNLKSVRIFGGFLISNPLHLPRWPAVLHTHLRETLKKNPHWKARKSSEPHCRISEPSRVICRVCDVYQKPAQKVPQEGPSPRDLNPSILATSLGDPCTRYSWPQMSMGWTAGSPDGGHFQQQPRRSHASGRILGWASSSHVESPLPPSPEPQAPSSLQLCQSLSRAHDPPRGWTVPGHTQGSGEDRAEGVRGPGHPALHGKHSARLCGACAWKAGLSSLRSCPPPQPPSLSRPRFGDRAQGSDPNRRCLST